MSAPRNPPEPSPPAWDFAPVKAAPPPCPEYFRWVLTLRSAVLGSAAGRLDPVVRASVLAELPAHERDLVAMGPPDAPLFELTRQAGRIWANTNEPLIRDYWAGVILALVSACSTATALSQDSGYQRRRQQALNTEARREVMGG